MLQIKNKLIFSVISILILIGPIFLFWYSFNRMYYDKIEITIVTSDKKINQTTLKNQIRNEINSVNSTEKMIALFDKERAFYFSIFSAITILFSVIGVYLIIQRLVEKDDQIELKKNQARTKEILSESELELKKIKDTQNTMAELINDTRLTLHYLKIENHLNGLNQESISLDELNSLIKKYSVLKKGQKLSLQLRFANHSEVLTEVDFQKYIIETISTEAELLNNYCEVLNGNSDLRNKWFSQIHDLIDSLLTYAQVKGYEKKIFSIQKNKFFKEILSCLNKKIRNDFYNLFIISLKDELQRQKKSDINIDLPEKTKGGK